MSIELNPGSAQRSGGTDMVIMVLNDLARSGAGVCGTCICDYASPAVHTSVM